MDPGADEEPSREELESRVAELEQTVSKMLPDRRGVLKGLGAAAIGGAAVGGATGGVSGQSAAGQIGTSSSPVDVEAANVNAGSVNTEQIPNVADHIVSGGDEQMLRTVLEGDVQAGDTVFVGPGTYSISEFQSDAQNNNTAISLGAGDLHISLSDDAVIERADANIDNILTNQAGSFIDSFDGPSNITIVGGTWDGGINLSDPSNILYFANCTDVTIKNATFRNVYDFHHIELHHLKNADIKNCEFKDLKTDRITEMVQLDHDKGTNTEYPIDNISIVNCDFEDTVSSGTAPQSVGVGSHNPESGVKYRDITIRDCRFETFEIDAIRGINWSDVDVSDCYINTNASEGQRKGIKLQSQSGETARELTITDTTITGGGPSVNNNAAIEFPADDGTSDIESVTVDNVTVREHGGDAIVCQGPSDLVVRSMTVNNVGGSGVVIRTDGNNTDSKLKVLDITTQGVSGDDIQIGGFQLPKSENVHIKDSEIAGNIDLTYVDVVEITGCNVGSISESADSTNVQRHDNYIGGTWVA